MRNRTIIGGIALVAVIVVAIVVTLRYNGSSSPAAELAFIDGMKPILAQSTNPTALDTARQQRAQMICKTITGLQATDWIGTVDKIDTSIGGGAILSVAVMPQVDFGTAPNAISNLSSNTLIAPDSALYHTIAGLQVGQKVRFTGQFFSSPSDCIQEASITTQGSMQNPLFVTRFVSITPLPHSDQ